MGNTIKLSATSDYETAGKQHIGHVTGLSSKFGFALEFVGFRSGKRNDVTTATVTVPGVYVEHDTTRKGTSDTYYIVWRDGADLTVQTIERDLAAELAAKMDEGAVDYTAAGRADMIAWHEDRISANADKDPEEVCLLKAPVGQLAAGRHRRADILAARRAELARLRGDATPERPLDLVGGPTDPAHRAARRAQLEVERVALARQLADLDAQIAELA